MTMKQVRVLIICLLLLSVVRGKDVTCKAGYGVDPGPTSRTSGLCPYLITTESECRAAANHMKKRFGVVRDMSYQPSRPPGCWETSSIWLNTNFKSKGLCSKDDPCICKTNKCVKCKPQHYSKGGKNAICEFCAAALTLSADQTDCYDPKEDKNGRDIQNIFNEIFRKIIVRV